jgi:aminopeptidase N
MAVTYESLKELRKKIDQMENELLEMRQSVDQMIAVHEHKPYEDWRSKIKWADTEALREWFEEWLKQLGINNVPIGAEKLQEMALEEGICPEDNFLSKGIIEMREE